MKEAQQKIHYREYHADKEIPAADLKLLKAARKAAAKAYAPYSGFRVGAALLLKNGRIVTGSNQENAAYPSGMCAERVAVFAAASEYPGVPMIALAITAMKPDSPVDYPISPCGACRQVLAEYETLLDTPLRMILAGESGKVIILDKAGELLPFTFNASHLKGKGKKTGKPGTASSSIR